MVGFPEAAIKGILRLSLLTLGRYHDRISRHVAEDVIVTLAKCHTNVTCQQLVTVLSDYSEAVTQRTNVRFGDCLPAILLSISRFAC